MKIIGIKTKQALLIIILLGSVATGFIFSVGGIFPELIRVNLSAADAVYEGGDTVGQVADSVTNAVLMPGMVWANGCTMNVVFMPLEEDLSGTHLLMELGSVKNGIGLYLIDGAVCFLTKQSSTAASVPTSLYDLDFSLDQAVAVTNSYGKLSARKYYTTAVSLDVVNKLIYFTLDDGQAVKSEFYQLLNYEEFNPNWTGDLTLSVKSKSMNSAGNAWSSGGLSASAGVWSQEGLESLRGPVERALFWNDDVYAPLEQVDPGLPLAFAEYAGNDTAGESTGSYSNTVSLSGMTWTNGCTMDIGFMPVEEDLSGTHLLMELGGTLNGIGLYLIDGVVCLITKQSAAAAAVPASLNDLDFASDRAVAVTNSYGKLSALNFYRVAVSLDIENRLICFSVDDGRTENSGLYQLYNYEGFDPNWTGNATLSVKTKSTGGTSQVGSQGGLSTAPGIWNEVDLKDFGGWVDYAFLWNDSAYVQPEQVHINLPLYFAEYDGTDTDGETAGSYSNAVWMPAADWYAGCTMSIVFVPAESDLTDTHLLMELGGTRNGVGLYLINGVIVFVTKQSALSRAVPASLYDLDFASDRTVAVTNSCGKLTAGLPYTAAVSLDVQRGLLYFSADNGVDLFYRQYELLNYNGADPNWTGDLTLSVRTRSTGGTYQVGSQGGLSTASGIWNEVDVKDLEGSVDRAVYWNSWALPRRQIRSSGADPDVCFDGTSFWMSCTSGGRNLPLLVSSDGSRFLPFKIYNPSAADPDYDYYCVWAPDISIVSNRCLLHFSAVRVAEGEAGKTMPEFHEEGKETTTFVADADLETMEFSAPELLLPTSGYSAYSVEQVNSQFSGDLKQAIRIDAELFSENSKDGRLFYVWFEGGNNIASTPWPERSGIISHIRPTQTSDEYITEGPSVFKRDDSYYLIYSHGHYTNNYCMSYVMASSPELLTMDQDVQSLSAASFDGGELIENAGHCSVLIRNNEYRLVYHVGKWVDSVFKRQIYWSPLYFNLDGSMIPLSGSAD